MLSAHGGEVTMSDRPSTIRRRLAAAIAVTLLELALFAVATAPSRADDVTLVESGSTLLYPVFKVWAEVYSKTHPGVKIATTASGSSAGIAAAISGAAEIGASDAYMSDADIRQNPTIINVPMAISAQTVNYNLPGLNNGI